MKYFSFFFCITFSISVMGQRFADREKPTEVKSLLNKDNELGGFGGFDIKVGQLHNDRSLIIGAYGGTIVNRNILFGIGGYGVATKNTFETTVSYDENTKELNLYGGYVGLILGGIALTKEVIHIRIPILFGAGSFEISDDQYFNFEKSTELSIENSAFFVVEPSLQLELNITKHLRLAAGASYRWIQGSDLSFLTDEQLSGTTTQLSVTFGRF